ncbi:acetyl-CoA C-acetyltransferase [Alicyclobacillus herbarius]|uniref:acetyl-CoA C-acetyltransferase n=1 Tax=Alicyclobacillus herbarius TaxID=122960 RepID=UPI0003F8FB79|nr:acetyl-CoA C-acetyltransferase [Alicyclobacillus herbarius]
MRRTAIVSYARTPFGRLGGALAGKTAVELGARAITGALSRAQLEPEQVDEVILGMVLQAGAGQIPSRQAARLAGFPWETPSLTVNKVCASGLISVALADSRIRAGDINSAVAGGMESMSNAPYALAASGVRNGLRMGDATLMDLMLHDGLMCPFENVHMGVYGSRVAAEFGISREAQDEFALASQQKAAAAIDAGRIAEEIVPVEVTSRRQTVQVETDEAPRRDTSLAKLAALSPAFEANGTITAGNAPGINDGAAALVLMEEAEAKRRGLQPLAFLLGHAQAADEAPYLAKTPALAIQNLLKKTGHSLDDIDLFEINEAFAAVVLTSAKMLGLSLEKVNVNGGAIAFGHPIGASGARILGTLILELRRRGGGLGIAAICSGTAQGDAVLVEVPRAV